MELHARRQLFTNRIASNERKVRDTEAVLSGNTDPERLMILEDKYQSYSVLAVQYKQK